MAEISLNAQKREITTKGAVKQMRRNGNVPGTLYLKGSEPISFSVNEVALNPLVFTAETSIINLKIDGTEQRCIIKDVQFDPVSDRVIHVDFQGVTVGQSLQLQIPVQITGNAVGVKEGGHLQTFLHKLDVECLPRHIPEHIQIDVTKLSVGDMIHVRDLGIENISILNAEDTVIVGVVAARGTTEETVEELKTEGEEQAEPEVISKGKSQEDE
ncbi:MAG: 50S ribosomal protein L25 [Melioribacteraceae bacterium]|nr:50S ribosomal protein L25 [Melioribacteraceae bacterium]